MMRAIVEVSPEFRAMVVETVETSRLNNSTKHLLDLLIKAWAKDQLLSESPSLNSLLIQSDVIVLDVPIPRGGQGANTTTV